MTTNTSLLLSVIPLISVTLGALITFLATHQLKKYELRLKINEKLIDKKILAYEKVIALSKHLKTTVSLKQVNEFNQILTSTYFLQNSEFFENFKGELYQTYNFNSHWLDSDTTNELGFLQIYVQNLDILLEEIKEEKWPQVGIILKPDFNKFATDLERKAISSLNEGITNKAKMFVLRDDQESHSLRLKDTTYLKKHHLLTALKNS